jgi:hypothetical protein
VTEGGLVLAAFVEALDAAGVTYMLTGSMAASLHGAVRTTEDVDVVVDATADQLEALAERLPERDWFFDLESALAARRRVGMTNAIHHASGWKFDLIFRKGTPFARQEFERRIRVDLAGNEVSVVAVEDLVVAKLAWASAGESTRQIEDVARLLVERPDLNFPHVERWVAELRLHASWDAARKLAGQV